MPNRPTGTTHTQQKTDDVQAHYDLSNEFFALFQDPTRTYSCAYFPREDMTLQEAQVAKLDLTLDKLRLEPGMTLLDIGCGWGSTMKRAIEKYDVNVIGLTLSKNQVEYCEQVLDTVDTNRSYRVSLRDWGEFDEPVDRIVTIEALEHFGFERYTDFFKFVYGAMPADGVMLLHSITGLTGGQIVDRGMPVSFEMARFVKFILTDIFPGGRLPSIEKVDEHAADAGFRVTRNQSLQSHFATTLDRWAEALAAHKDEAIAIQSEEVYERYMKYLTGCAKAFRVGYIDCNQFTLEK
jgi:cyclopropane-fatty-acyl-phospholipid synthase